MTSSASILQSDIKEDRIISLEHITKSFPGVKALDNVSFSIKKQEVLAILGENGAGKSTLMKILSGLYQPDEGRIQVNQKWFNYGDENQLKPMEFSDPRTAMKLGIGMVYQHFQLVEPFTVVDNITLGKEFTKGMVFIHQQKAIREIKKISNDYGLPINPTAIIEDLPVGLKQRVEIIKQLYRDADLLILDEPTAVLTPKEADELFTTIRRLKDTGKSIIFITHKLREPLAVADRIIVLRRGKYVGEILPENATTAKLAEMVVGRKVIQQYERTKQKMHNHVLEVDSLNVKSEDKQVNVVKNNSFQVRSGEIVGIAGVQGNGQSELVETIMGLRQSESGTILYHLDEVYDLTDLPTIEILTRGIGFIPEDRTRQGLILDFSLRENIWLGFHGYQDNQLQALEQTLDIDEPEEPEDKGIVETVKSFFQSIYDSVTLPFELIRRLTLRVIDQLDVRTASDMVAVKNLSGGNQQKVVIGREFAKEPRLIIAAEPTRGVDIGVMTEVHKELIKRRNNGVSILLVSSDLDEVLNLSDRIIVMYEGKIVGYGDLAEFTTEQISELMTSGQFEEGKQ